MKRRIFALYFVLLAGFIIVSCSLLLLCTNEVYADAARAQSTFSVPLESGRGNFFDCQFRRLTGTSCSRFALVAPTEASYRTLFDAVLPESRSALYAGVQRSVPFLVPLQADAQANGYLYTRLNRNAASPTAVHLLGYCDSTGNGVAGLERVFNTQLRGGSTSSEILCAVNAQGGFISTIEPAVREERGTGFGVMLTLDAALQRACEAIAQEMMERGSIVVLETATGRIRACVSMPWYNPSSISESLAVEGSPFVNRSLSAYNVGSVFKPLLAVAALEQGLDTEAVYTCTGSVTVGGHIYRCAYGRGHGEMNLETALCESCNCYFVELGAQLGGAVLEQAMWRLGFGESTQLAESLQSAAGNVPTAQELENLGALASVSFGQGTLLATPLQIAAFFNTIANDGLYLSPTLVEGAVDEYTEAITESYYDPVRRQSIDPAIAARVCEMLVSVVEDGLGESAKPARGGAGGKTGTAQTGRFDENGEEIMDAWFAGFYPAAAPEYTIAVLLDSGTQSGTDACHVFARVADVLSYFVNAEVS